MSYGILDNSTNEKYDLISCTTVHPYNIVMAYDYYYRSIYSPFHVTLPTYMYRGNSNSNYRPNTDNVPKKDINGKECYCHVLDMTYSDSTKGYYAMTCCGSPGAKTSNLYSSKGMAVGTVNYYSTVAAAIIVSGIKSDTRYAFGIKGINGTSCTGIDNSNSYLQFVSGSSLKNDAICLNADDGVYMLAKCAEIRNMYNYCNDTSKFPINTGYCSAPMLFTENSEGRVLDSTLALSKYPIVQEGGKTYSASVNDGAAFTIAANETKYVKVQSKTPDGLIFDGYGPMYDLYAKLDSYSITEYYVSGKANSKYSIETQGLPIHTYGRILPANGLAREGFYENGKNDLIEETGFFIINKSNFPIIISGWKTTMVTQ